MARAATWIGLALAIFAQVEIAGAQGGDRLDDPFEITADRIRFDDELDLYVAERNVRVVQGERRMRARWIAFSTLTRLGVAEGDVYLLDEDGSELRAQFMVFDVDTLQGTLFQGVLDAGDGGFHVRAKKLVRTGRNEFEMKNGVFSTCRCEEDEKLPWQIRAHEAEVEMGGYGTVKNSTFEVLEVPVLWIPWAFFPVKSERETGFLLPEFSFGGRGGASVGLPFFWAARDDLNVTATPRYYAERGYKQDLQLEYVFGEASSSDLFVAGLKDESKESTSDFRDARWAVLWDHDQHLPAEWRWRADLKMSSDNQYASDFRELREYNAFRFIESSTNVARDFGRGGGFGAMGAARFADDIQGSTFTDRDDTMLQRFGEVRGDAAPGAVMAPFGVEARFDSEVIHFQSYRTPNSRFAVPPVESVRNDGRFFDVGVDGFIGGDPGTGEGDGIFQPGEPLDHRGTRVILHPRVARPFDLGGVAEFVPEVGWQQTLYRSNNQKFAERGLFTARGDLRTRFARDYGADAEGRDWSLRHVIEPRLGWALVSQRKQKSNPRFVPLGSVEQVRVRTLALESVTRNPSDRTPSANQLVLGFGQRFFTRRKSTGAPRLQADLVTTLDWDFGQTESLGNFVLDGRLFPIGPFSSRARVVFDPEAAKFEEGESEFGLDFPVSHFALRRLSIFGRYRYLRRVPFFFETFRGSTANPRPGDGGVNQIDLTTSVELAWRMRLSYSTIYSLRDDGGVLRNRGLFEYVSKCNCWGAGLEVEHERQQGFRFGVSVRFLGLGETKDPWTGGLGTGFQI